MSFKWVLFDVLEFPVFGSNKVGTAEGLNLKPYQVIVWISVTPSVQSLSDGERGLLPSNTPTLPAVLDSGSTSTLTLREEHLQALGFNSDDLHFQTEYPKKLKTASGVAGLAATMLADVWLRSANPQSAKLVSYRLPLGFAGINVYPTGGVTAGRHVTQEVLNAFLVERRLLEPTFEPIALPGPQLPILGINGLSQGHVKFQLDCSPDLIKVFIWVRKRVV